MRREGSIALVFLLSAPALCAQDEPGIDDRAISHSEFVYERARHILHPALRPRAEVTAQDEKTVAGAIPMACQGLEFVLATRLLEARRAVETKRAAFDRLKDLEHWARHPRSQGRALREIRRLYPEDERTWEEWMAVLPAWHQELMKDAGELLANGTVSDRRYAARWIWQRCRIEDEGLLLRALSDPDPLVAWMAPIPVVTGLPVTDRVVDRVAELAPEAMAHGFLDATQLLWVLEWTSNPTATARLVELYSRVEGEEDRWRIREALAGRKDSAKADFFRQLLASEDPAERAFAASVLAGLREGVTPEEVEGLLEYPDPAVLKKALWSVQWRPGSPGLTRRIVALLEHPDPEVASAAAIAAIGHRQVEGIAWWVAHEPRDAWRGRVRFAPLADLGWPFPSPWNLGAESDAEWARFREWWRWRSLEEDRDFASLQRDMFAETLRRARVLRTSPGLEDLATRLRLVELMVPGLSSRDRVLRRQAIGFLSSMTGGDTFGYDAEGDLDRVRWYAVDEWRMWARGE